eukprot:1058462-Rhodomonas_salina.2
MASMLRLVLVVTLPFMVPVPPFIASELPYKVATMALIYGGMAHIHAGCAAGPGDGDDIA